MSETANEHVVPPGDVVAAAREFIRRDGDCVVSIGRLLDELTDKFGDRFRVSPDVYKVLDLIETLWADPHVDQVPHGWIEFAWSEEAVVDKVLSPDWRQCSWAAFQIPSATKVVT
jgi:hypothetical protein